MGDMTYTISTADDRDETAIEDFLHDSFFKDMPLFKIFGIEEVPRMRIFSKESKETIPFVVKAVSKEGAIVGVALCRSKTVFPPTTNETDVREIQMKAFMKYVETVSRVSELPGRTLELRILSVAPEWRCKGIAKELTEESLRVAKVRGFDVMKICCTNEFTAKLAQRLGFQELYKFAYSDYASDVVLNTCPPHLHIYYYVTALLS